MTTTPLEILEAFIADENEALQEGRQGGFFPSNHHRITPLIPKAAKLLATAERQQFYFHLLRLGTLPTIKVAEEMAVLTEAYRQLLPLFGRGYPIMHLSNATGLLLFGFDPNGDLPGEKAANFNDYVANLRLWNYLNCFSHIPGMLKKQKNFQELAANPSSLLRIQKTMAHIQYRHDGFSVHCLWFWAMIFVLLSEPTTAEAIVRNLLASHADTSDMGQYQETLCRYISVTGRDDLLAIAKT